MRTQRHGFTLVELLVVIAIISVLAAMLLPALEKARESGVQTACASQMRQLALGLQGYADGNSGFAPPSSYDAPPTTPLYGSTGKLYWNNLLKPYVGDATPDWCSDYSPMGEVFFCPNSWYLPTQKTKYTSGGRVSGLYTGIGYNNCGLGNSVWPHTQNLNRIQQPSRILFITDTKRDDPTLPYIAMLWYPWWDFNRHEDRANLAWVDGHVNARTERMIVGEYGTEYNTWTGFYKKYPYMEANW